MTRLDISGAPYFDDYDPSKDYIQIPAIPGRVAQAREFTQAQTIARSLIKSLGDAIMKDGDIIEGCQVIVAPDKLSVTVTEGRIYVDGIVSKFAGDTVVITGVGPEVIGIKVNDVIIDESSDTTLKDPAQGYDNYNEPGSHRIKRTLTLTVNDVESSPIATLNDGDLFIETYAPEYSALTQTLARRTHDESGSYIVHGLDIRVEPSENPANYVAVVEAGKAYVMGYELSIPTPRRLEVARSTAYGPVVASNYTYQSGLNRYILDKYNYVKAINKVTGIIPKSSSGSVASTTSSYDLGTLPVTSIVSVTQGGTTFVVSNIDASGQVGVDCYLHRDGTHYYLVWNGSSMVNSLSVGSSFTVSYRVTTTFTLTSDYILTREGGSDYIEWVGSTQEDHPINGTNFTVEYDQYFARKDIVYIDMYGNTEVVMGIPNEVGYEAKPGLPLNTLELGVVSSPPNGTPINPDAALRISTNSTGLTRFTMEDISKILRKLKTIEYDQAVIALNTDARQIYTVNDKKGIMTDPFIDLSRIDFYYNLLNGGVVNPSKPVFEMALDLSNNICYLPIVTDTRDLVIDTGRSTGHVYDRIMTLDVTGEKIVLSQNSATKLYLVNPYTVFPQMPEISIDPAVDNWIEETVIQVPVSLTDQTIVATTSSVVDQSIRIRRRFQDYTVTTQDITYTQAGTRVSVNSTDSLLDERAITFIRPRVITVKGTDFYPGLDNIKGYFDGKLVSLTPTGGTPAGSIAGTVKAKSDGKFSCTFTIPSGVHTGVRAVKFESSINIAGYQNYAMKEYQAYGTTRTIQRTVTTITTVLLTRIIKTTRTTYVDPLAQTFVLDKMTLLKGVDLYFGFKAESEPVVVEIRGVTNGVIDDTVYGVTSKLPSQVKVSNNASAATRFTFDDPILLEENKEYAFVVRSSSDRYLIWVAELGENDVATGSQVLQNAYLSGLMFSSSNNSSWTAHQTTDIKFKLIADTYNTMSSFYFNNLSGVSAARLYLVADTLYPVGTNATWYYSLEGSNTYETITPYVAKLLNKISTNVDIKVVLTRTTGTDLTPMISRDTVSLALSKWKIKGAYITKNVTNLDPYTNVKVVVDTFIPGGTNLVFKCSNNDGSTLNSMSQTSSTDLGDGWSERVYEYTSGSSTQFKLFIEASSNYEYSTPVIRRLRMIMS